MLLELLTTVAEISNLEESEKWAATFLDELRRMDPDNILPGTYISVTPPGWNPFVNMFGSSYKTLLELKRMHDPEGLFGLAQPEI